MQKEFMSKTLRNAFLLVFIGGLIFAGIILLVFNGMCC